MEVEPFLDFENILRTGLSFPSFSLGFGPFVFWKLAPCWEVVLAMMAVKLQSTITFDSVFYK